MKLDLLQIEDSELDAELISTKLSEAGYELNSRVISNEADFRAALNAKKWDVILCDYSMPTFNPFEAIEILKEFEIDIPLIVISGTVGEENIIRLLKAGCHGFINKQNLDRIPSVVQREIEDKKVRIENKLLQEKLSKYQLLAAKAYDAMLFLDENGNIIDNNVAACRIYGYSDDEFTSLNFFSLSHRPREKNLDQLFNNLDYAGIVHEEKHYKKNNEQFHVEVSLARDLIGDKTVFYSLIRDITEKKKYEENLKHLSYHDQLTGLYNRRFFEEELNRLDAKRNLPISLMMADINGLKVINDSFGHTVGDDYLIKLAEILKTTCRSDEIIARLGGDEFIVVLPKTNGDQTAKIVKRLKDEISKVNTGKIDLSVSFGFDTKESEDQLVSDVLVSAENHMYTHKIAERSSMRGNTVGIIMNHQFVRIMTNVLSTIMTDHKR